MHSLAGTIHGLLHGLHMQHCLQREQQQQQSAGSGKNHCGLSAHLKCMAIRSLDRDHRHWQQGGNSMLIATW
jgi:hypothetical protein